MPLRGIRTQISAAERPQTYTLDGAANGTSFSGAMFSYIPVISTTNSTFSAKVLFFCAAI
jgi:hypothetical protein